MCDKKIGEIIEITSGYAFSSDFFDQSHGIPLVRIRDIANEKTEVRYTGPYSNEYVLKNGDLVVGMDGDFNIFRWKGGTALLNQRVCKIEPVNRNDLDKSFLYWYLQPHLEKIHAITPQTTVKHLSVKDIVGIDWLGLSLEEQKHIGVVLDLLEQNIKLTLLTIEKLNRKKQGLLNDLLTRGVDSHGNLRPSYEDVPYLYQETELGFIPKEWDISLLDDIATRGSGHTPNKNVPSYWNGGIKWVSLADSSKLDQIHISETDKEISHLGIQNSSAVMHCKGTVILSRDAGIGKSAILTDDMAVSQHFMAWKCSKRLNNYFLYYLLQKDKPVFENIAIGSTIKTIGLPFFKTYKIAVPSISEQEKVSALLLDADKYLSDEVNKLNKLEKVKIGLLEDLLQN